MKPLNCCKGCKELNKNGTFKNKLKCLLSCDKYILEDTKRLYNEQKENKGCSTCRYCEHAYNYPGFVTAEESICKAGLKCDTVYFMVKNCPKWICNDVVRIDMAFGYLGDRYVDLCDNCYGKLCDFINPALPKDYSVERKIRKSN